MSTVAELAKDSRQYARVKHGDTVWGRDSVLVTCDRRDSNDIWGV